MKVTFRRSLDWRLYNVVWFFETSIMLLYEISFLLILPSILYNLLSIYWNGIIPYTPPPSRFLSCSLLFSIIIQKKTLNCKTWRIWTDLYILWISNIKTINQTKFLNCLQSLGKTMFFFSNCSIIVLFVYALFEWKKNLYNWHCSEYVMIIYLHVITWSIM